jgi:hypothetical protein
MTDPVRLGELMNGDFVILAEGGDDSTRQELQLAGQQMAVTINRAGQVCSVWSAEGRGTPIVASTTTPAADIAEAGSLVGELTRKGTAIVVLSEARPVGVISAGRFARYLADERGTRLRTFGEVTVGDAGLAGPYTQGHLVIFCNVCGWRNQLRSWTEGVTRCTNPAPPEHVLVRR